jgi:Ca2+-binding RTX toxin-like protein
MAIVNGSNATFSIDMGAELFLPPSETRDTVATPIHSSMQNQETQKNYITNLYGTGFSYDLMPDADGLWYPLSGVVTGFDVNQNLLIVTGVNADVSLYQTDLQWNSILMAGNDTIIGGSKSDTLYGFAGDDVIEGGSGHDTINGNSGIDSMFGGDGSDTYYVDNIGDVVTETNASASAGGTDLVNSYLSVYTLGANVENGRILASGAANLTGNTLDNMLYASLGNNQLDGGAGRDTAIYSGLRANYTVTKNAAGFAVVDKTGAGGSDQLLQVERIKFADMSVGLDIAEVGRLYQAAFNRTPDPRGLGYWISVMDSGVGLKDIARGLVNSDEFKALYGANPSNTDIIARYYENVLHRPAEPAGLNFWVSVLDNKSATTAEVLGAFSESAENQAAHIGVIGNGFDYILFA